jgi:hypothetical protein
LAMDYGLAASKWRQYERFSKDSKLKTFLPDTRLLNNGNLIEFLKLYPTVFLKPIDRGKGQGILVVHKKEKGYNLYVDTKKYSFSSDKLLQNAIHTHVNRPNRYIIQEGIQLLQWESRPIDFRLYVAKQSSGWKSLGMMGKWAAPNRRITNRSVGGRAVPFYSTLQRAGKFNRQQCQELEKQVLQLGEYLARNYFNYALELGLDFGLDQNRKLYIIEGNTLPGIQLFRHHPNKKLTERIRKHHFKARERYKRKS